ncbi:unnamed protein product, partial [Dibothriocephalus latus]
GTALRASKEATRDEHVLVQVEDEAGVENAEPSVSSQAAFFADVRVEKADFLQSPPAFEEEKEKQKEASTPTFLPSSALFYSLPYPDLEGRGLVMSISQAFYDNDVFLGVMGVDMHVADLLDQVIHFGSGGQRVGHGSSSAFIVHAPNGYTVSHPALTDLL